MKRYHQIRAVALSTLMITAVFAGVPIMTDSAVATDDPENWTATGESYEPIDDIWPQAFAVHEGDLYVGAAENNNVHVLDSNLEQITEYSIDAHPSGLTRFNGEWLVSSGEDQTLYRYDDEFDNREVVLDESHFTETDFNEAPWNIDVHNGKLYVADAGEVAVFNDEYEEVDRLDVATDMTYGLHIADGSLFAMGDDDGVVYEHDLDGTMIDMTDIGDDLGDDANGIVLYEDHWYVGVHGADPALYEFHADVDRSAGISGVVTDQNDERVPHATVTAWGVRETNLDADPENLRAEAETLLEELEDPLPDSFDRDYDLDSHTDADTTYALVHEKRDWNMGTTTIVESSIDDPRVTLERDREIVISLWDPTGESWLENQVDGSFPGETTEGEVVVDQLGPGDETTDTRTYETQPIATTTGANPFTETEHHGVRTRLPVGVYHVYPAGNPGAGYVTSVGAPDEIAAGVVDNLEDEAGQLTARAERIQELRDEEVIVRETVQANAEGEYELEIDEDVTVATVEAIRADGELLAGLEDPSLEDLREARLNDFDGTVYLPAPDGQTVDPPADDVEVNVYKSPEIPFEEIESYADLQAFLEGEFLDDEISDYEDPFEDIDTDELEALLEELEALGETNDELADVLADLEDIEDLNEQIDELYAELEALQTIDSGDGDGLIEDGVLEFWQEFDGSVDEAVVTLEYENGDVETVPDEYVEIDSGGWFGDDQVSVAEYPIPEDRAVADVSIEVANSDGTGSGGGVIENPAVDGVADAVDALDFSSLSPGPNERVSVGLESDAGASVQAADVLGPDGTAINTTLEDDRVRFDTDGAGLYTVRKTVANSGQEIVVTERVRAGDHARSDPATVRAGQSVGGEYAVVGEHLESGSIEIEHGSVDVTAVVAGDDAPPEVHIQPESVLERTNYEFEIDVVRGSDEQQVRSNVLVALQFTDSFYNEDTIAWKNGDSITWDGDTRHGEVQERNDGEKLILYSHTEEDGTATLEVDSSPGPIDELLHWLDYGLSPSNWSLPVLQVSWIGAEPVSVASTSATHATAV